MSEKLASSDPAADLGPREVVGELEPKPLCAPFGKYEVSQVLTLNPLLNQSSSSKLRVRVSKLHEPWTLSCGMVVEILESDLQDTQSSATKGKTAFLKLFDRCYASQLRQGNEISDWNKDTEDAFLNFIQSSRAEKSLLNYELTEEEWDAAENETFLANKLQGLYTAETSTYADLDRYQGELIPRLLTPISLDITYLSTDNEAGKAVELYQAKGVLLEYLQGFTLSILENHAPQSSWQDIVDQAIHIVHVLGDNDSLNADVRPDNFIVVPRSNNRYQVFMIDFGQCRRRGADESAFDWGRAKWRQDEEGAVGFVMQHRLRKFGFELVFNHSYRYLEYAETEDE